MPITRRVAKHDFSAHVAWAEKSSCSWSRFAEVCRLFIADGTPLSRELPALKASHLIYSQNTKLQILSCRV